MNQSSSTVTGAVINTNVRSNDNICTKPSIPNPEIKPQQKTFRFKTINEFEKQYGVTWRTSLPITWTPIMDHLAGKYKTFSHSFSTCSEMFIELTPRELALYDNMRITYKKFADQLKKDLTIKTNNQYSELHYNQQMFAIIYAAPTGNCQLSSIAYLNNILAKFTTDQVKMLFYYLNKENILSKKLLLFDINNCYITKMQNAFVLFKDEIHRYTSSNGSSMAYGIIDIYKTIENITE